MPYLELARILTSAANARAAEGLIAAFEECEGYRPLLERQKATLVKNLLTHFQGLETEFEQLMEAAAMVSPSLVEDLGAVVRAEPWRVVDDD